MRAFEVFLEIAGQSVLVGSLKEGSAEQAVFCYDDAYLSSPDAQAISVSLPLKPEPFSEEETRCFFEGLLPEGFTRRAVAERMHLPEYDFLSLLYGLGKECLGAIRVSAGEPSEVAYERLTMEEIKALAKEGAMKSAEVLMKTHLSLTGASGKVGLYFEEKEGAWYLPKGTAPSTHIVKQSHVRLHDIVVNETMSLRAAARLGIEVPDSFILEADTGIDDTYLFATKRFDRVFSDAPKFCGDLPIPLRLHQEDFAQALGISSSRKYEPAGEHYLARMFRLLREGSLAPMIDQQRLWDRIVFNVLLGNTDAHIKNFALVYTPDLTGYSLAPAYDLLCTTMYPSSTREMAFHIGDHTSIDEVTREDLEEAAEESGMGTRFALRRFDQICDRFEQSVTEAAEEMSEQGFQNAGKVKEAILQTGAYRRMI
ncbi:MAG: type II toxin-antitoxin system HipA family toxin [Lachnospiraceae bacterium]|nr:type II toxin-antitoxin system HipA family toxin [Lachnospiraceae bacterium]